MAEQKPFEIDAEDMPTQESKVGRARVLQNGIINPDTYEVSDRFQPSKGVNDIHTTPELIEALKQHKDVDVAAKVICREKGGGHSIRTMGKAEFLKSWDSMRESTSFDFDTDLGANVVGAPDYTPLLGGPFYKQLYYYDYMRMHSACFYAYHHDPFAKAGVRIMRDFVLGRGYRVDCDNPFALAIWRAFEEANELESVMEQIANELCIYGETMPWFLPNNEVDFVFRPAAGDVVRKGKIPRIRLIDPSVIWEIVTQPEDIKRVLYYQWVAPTQYQIYTDGSVPSSKFIVQQIPADQIIHVKVNAVSNEKRGRSDMFPVLGYLKRLRDAVNYAIVREQKNSAWAIDTVVKGNQSDIDRYVSSQQSLGTIPHAGSEFVHSEAVERKYLSNEHASGGSAGSAFDWCLSEISAGWGIPVSYWGAHISGGQTRASAIVATEPVAKMFEMRQLVLERLIKKMIKKVLRPYDAIVPGFSDTEFEVTFPEIITQDRSQKLKDLLLAETSGWISKKTAATIASKEFNITEYDYEEEQEEIKKDGPLPELNMTPLTSPGQAPGEEPSKPSAVTGDERHSLAMSYGA